MTLVVNIVTVALAADVATGGKNTINKPVKQKQQQVVTVDALKRKQWELKKLGTYQESGLGVQSNMLGGDKGVTGG